MDGTETAFGDKKKEIPTQILIVTAIVDKEIHKLITTACKNYSRKLPDPTRTASQETINFLVEKLLLNV